jgi:hypothetical protein
MFTNMFLDKNDEIERFTNADFLIDKKTRENFLKYILKVEVKINVCHRIS